MSAVTSPQLDALLSRLQKVKARSGGFEACCPAHEDKDPSLSVGDGDTCVVMYCWTGCSPKAIVEAVGLTLPEMFYEQRPRNGSSAAGVLTPAPKAKPKRNARGMAIEAEMAAERLQGEDEVLSRLRTARGWAAPALYRLRVGWDGERLTIPVKDREGKPHDVLRYDPFGRGKFKMLAGQGKSRMPWPSPEGQKPKPGWPFVLVEGEGTAIAMASLGIAATALPGAVSRPTGDIGHPGAFKGPGWHPSWSRRVSGDHGRVLLIPDCDDSGHTLMRTVQYDLERSGVRIVYLDLKLAKGEDVGDVVQIARTGQVRGEAKTLLRACLDCAERKPEQLPEALEMLAAWRAYHS